MLSIVLVMIGLVVLNILPNSLNILAIATIILIVGYKWKNLKKYSLYLYLFGFIIAVLSIYFNDSPILRIVYRGFLGYAFIFVVMFTGVLPNKWTLTRNLKKSRGTFSILAFIFISSHAILHLFMNFGIDLFGLVSFVLMIPLTIISFQLIRKEMNPSDWFKIQKVAYGVYLLLFVHLLIVSSDVDKIFYAVFATLYINNKLIKEYKK